MHVCTPVAQKQMVLVAGVIYLDYVPRGHSVNIDYIMESLGRYIKKYRQKRPLQASQAWFFHWDNDLAHTTAAVQFFIAAKGIRTIHHPPYLLDLTLADYFLFPTMKRELADKSLTQNTFKTARDGVI